MRLVWTCLALVASLGVAHAGRTTVVVMADPDHAAALNSALQVTLAGRDVAIASAPAPEGALRLARAAAAQHAAVSLGADAALWIDHEAGSTEVCAVSPDGGYFRHAPIASESPRAFAEIAASLVDELFAPPEGLNVHGDVHIDGGYVGANTLPLVTAPPIASPPALAPTDVVATTTEPRVSGRTLLEVGMTFALVDSYLAAGIEGEVAFPLASWLRVGAGTHMLKPFTQQTDIAGAEGTIGASYLPGVMYDVFGELRYTSPGRHHADVGLIGGYMPSIGDGFGGASYPRVIEIGARLGYSWELVGSGISLSLVPCALYSPVMHATADAAFLTLRWEVPL